MNRIITDDQELRAFIPNVFETVDDESTFYSKVSPHISTAERFLSENITGTEIFDSIADGTAASGLCFEASAFVAAYAYELAVPGLDLILTPNGFGVVNTETVAPASRDRVQNLTDSLARQRCRTIVSLLSHLRKDESWLSSECAHWFARSVFFSPADLDLFGPRPADSWLELTELRAKSAHIETKIAAEWISPELYAKFCSSLLAGNAVSVARSVKAVVVDAVRTGTIDTTRLADIVTYIRNSPDLFPEWHKSKTAELFTPPTFVNDKQNGGYFF